MKDKPTLKAHLAGPFQDEMAQYQAIVAEAEAYLDSFAEPLHGLARPHFETLIEGEFAQVVALLPFWLSDLAPLPTETNHRLGVAHLYFWWYYYLQDEMIDGDAPPVALLSAHLALLKMVEVYEQVGVTGLPCWPDYYRLALRSAQAHAVELESRFERLADLTPVCLARINLDFIEARVAPLFFNTAAQLHLAGTPADSPLHTDLIGALRCFALARQVGDDANDWLTDLQAGQLNYVSARLMSRFYQTGQASQGAELEPERLAGYQLGDETFWAEIEQTSLTLHRQALDHLATYGDCRLRGLIEKQMAQHEAMWVAGRRYRAGWREAFRIEVR